MSTLTFSQGGNTAVLTGSVVYGTNSYSDRLNQFQLSLADGEDVVYDGGPSKRICTLVMKGIDYDQGVLFETWLKTKLIYSLNKFGIAAVTGIDLGAGKGQPIANARFIGKNSSQGVIELVPPGKWNIKFNYSFIES